MPARQKRVLPHRAITRFIARLIVTVVATASAPNSTMSADGAEAPAAVDDPQTGTLAPAPMDLCAQDDGGFLSGRLHGALDLRVDWRGGDMDCGGMLRPDDDGIRLVFAAPRTGERLLIVLGIAGRLDELDSGERATNITIIDESGKRFFSTGGRHLCWSVVESVRPVAGADDRIMQIAGEVYCSASLPSLSDNGSVALRDLHYSGRVLLNAYGPG